MIAPKNDIDALARPASPGAFCIRLNASRADCEDAWDLRRTARNYGGVEVRDGCFVFATQERWLTAWEALRLRFGAEYFDVVESANSLTA